MQFKATLGILVTNLLTEWTKLSIRVRHTKLVYFRPDRQTKVWKIVQRTPLCSFPAQIIEFYFKNRRELNDLNRILEFLRWISPRLAFFFFSFTWTFLRLIKSIATHAFPSRSKIFSHSNFSSSFISLLF